MKDKLKLMPRTTYMQKGREQWPEVIEAEKVINQAEGGAK